FDLSIKGLRSNVQRKPNDSQQQDEPGHHILLTAWKLPVQAERNATERLGKRRSVPPYQAAKRSGSLGPSGIWDVKETTGGSAWIEPGGSVIADAFAGIEAGLSAWQ